LVLDFTKIAQTDISECAKMTRWHTNSKYFEQEPGKEHYRLLAYISSLLPPGTAIADVGTYLGFSALALSHNVANTVTTYDIDDCLMGIMGNTAKKRENIRFKIRNCMDCVDDIAKCPLILLDIDPHDGKQETTFFEKLRDIGYNGVVICDDIYLNDNMRNFWSNVKEKKYDLTHVGHWSGTGIVTFGDQSIIIT
jgi:predicted O-methyltransferase YrrM